MGMFVCMFFFSFAGLLGGAPFYEDTLFPDLPSFPSPPPPRVWEGSTAAPSPSPCDWPLRVSSCSELDSARAVVHGDLECAGLEEEWTF